jgi:hypothetical protein
VETHSNQTGGDERPGEPAMHHQVPPRGGEDLDILAIDARTDPTDVPTPQQV